MSARSRLGAPLLILLLAASPRAFAAPPTVADVARGATLAVPCQACHGDRGQGTPAAGFPRIAGQTAAYLDKQLADYASGARTHSIMSPFAKGMDAQTRADLAAHFSALSPNASVAPHNVDDSILSRGRMLAWEGDESKQLQACGNCHGPDGRGEPMAAPYLAGQSATYLKAVIAEWKNGARHNDGGHLMATVANRLDEADVEAVAEYFESVGPLP